MYVRGSETTRCKSRILTLHIGGCKGNFVVVASFAYMNIKNSDERQQQQCIKQFLIDIPNLPAPSTYQNRIHTDSNMPDYKETIEQTTS